MRPTPKRPAAWKTSTLVPRCLLAASLTWLHVGPCLAAEDGEAATPPADSASPCVLAAADADSGQIEIRDGDQPVLRYNYRTVELPEKYLDKISANNRKYARARSNYIHPLYGPEGQELTLDWDESGHPHHRGIYWAWPEVDYRGERGDLHALQRVFARPTGNLQLRHGRDFAEIEAENDWLWDDETPIVRETVTIRAYAAGGNDRTIDLTFAFVAREDSVTLARRATTAYGGLNIRMAPVTGLELSHHVDDPQAQPRPAWQYASGVWPGSRSPATFVVLEHADNPDYPGDYIQYPELPWFQPTFPRSGTRFSLSRDKPLTLRYRLWILQGGPPAADALREQWTEYNTTAPSDRTSRQGTRR